MPGSLQQAPACLMAVTSRKMNAGIFPKSPTRRLIRTAGDRIHAWSKDGGRLCVVSYHRILEEADLILGSEPDLATFKWQVALLAECFNVLPLAQALDALKQGSLPPRAVCITFDDGYRSTHDLALPVLKEFGLPATVFVTTGYVDGRSMWNDNIVEAIRSMPGKDLDLRDLGLGMYSLATPHDRQRATEKLIAAAKYLPTDSRNDLTRKLLELGRARDGDDLMLSREMICALSRQGIEIGGHTVSHPILSGLPDEMARKEIIDNKRQLEEIIGEPIRFFAYPNGKPGIDFDHRHAAMARDAGYQAAFTTSFGAITADKDTYQLPRGRPWDAQPFFFGVRLLLWLAGRAG